MKMHRKMHDGNGKITRYMSCGHDEMRDVVSAAVPRNDNPSSFFSFGGVLKTCKMLDVFVAEVVVFLQFERPVRRRLTGVGLDQGSLTSACIVRFLVSSM
jgi:hypothetical protein